MRRWTAAGCSSPKPSSGGSPATSTCPSRSRSSVRHPRRREEPRQPAGGGTSPTSREAMRVGRVVDRESKRIVAPRRHVFRHLYVPGTEFEQSAGMVALSGSVHRRTCGGTVMRTPTILLVLGFLLIFAAPAALAVTPQAPSVVTGAAGQVTGKSASLSGTVTSNGAHTTYTFQYGTSTSYGFQTHVRTSAGTPSSRTVYAHLGRLTPGTGVPLSPGRNQSGPAPALARPDILDHRCGAFRRSSRVRQGRVTGKSATLSGTLGSNGSRTAYLFQYGTTTAYDLQTQVRDARSRTRSTRTVYAHLGRLAPGPRTTTGWSRRTGQGRQVDQTFTTTAVRFRRSPRVRPAGDRQVGDVERHAQQQRQPDDLHVPVRHHPGPTASRPTSRTPARTRSTARSTRIWAELAPGTAYHYRLVATNKREVQRPASTRPSRPPPLRCRPSRRAPRAVSRAESRF
jgi:hypothetical protein